MKHSHLASLALALALVPVAASALTVSNLSDGSLSGNTLTVTAAVDDVAASTTVTLWLGAAAPKDGDPANLLQAVDTQTITAGQTVTFDTHVVLGTKVAFKIAATDGTNSA